MLSNNKGCGVVNEILKIIRIKDNKTMQNEDANLKIS